MKRVLTVWVLVFFAVFGSARERILSYHSLIKVEESGDLLVQEDITVQAEGNEIKRGIYRSFPTKYSDKLGTRFNVGFDVVIVLKNGEPEPYFTEKKSNGVVVYIGDKNQYLSSGIYTYTLTYRTSKQIGFFKEFDELYFNAIGGDWTFPIEEASVVVELPDGANVIQMDAFSGFAGNTTCDCEIISEQNRVVITTKNTLQPKEQLTFAVAWPKGFVHEPAAAEKWISFLKNNFHVGFAFISLLIATMVYYQTWRRVGVDPPKKTIFPQFDPPPGFSPGELAVMDKIRQTQRTVSAAIVDMAVKGHILIDYSKKKYTLERVSDQFELLSDDEKALSAELFSKGITIVLDNKNHAVFAKASTKAFEVIKKKLQPEYFSFNHKHLIAGILTSITCVILTFVFSPTAAVPLILLFFFVALVILFTYLIKAPTVKGRAIMDDIEGFKMHLNVAEKNQLDVLHEPEMTIERFESLLPFAIALGVENQWGKKFEKALKNSLQETQKYQPAWYRGTASAVAFSPARFSSDLGRSFTSAISAASTPPGKSSGSGGGGSSGGGGGGGGGGGW